MKYFKEINIFFLCKNVNSRHCMSTDKFSKNRIRNTALIQYFFILAVYTKSFLIKPDRGASKTVASQQAQSRRFQQREILNYRKENDRLS